MPSSREEPKARSARSQTLERGLDIIETVMSADGQTLRDIAAARGLSYSTVHRIASVLAARGYLRMDASNRVSLGARLLEAGFTAYQRLDIVQIARPFLEHLAAETSDTIHLARLEGSNVIYLDKIPGMRPMEIRSSIGSVRTAITTGVGKAMLLNRSGQELREMFEAAKHKMARDIAVEDWLAEMQDFAGRACALDLGDAQPEIRCIAAPIFDAWGKIVAAVSVTSSESYLPPERMKRLAPEVKKTAYDISRALGHRLPDP